jgi:hypothetical protein
MQQIVSIVKLVGPESGTILDDLRSRASGLGLDVKTALAELKSRLGPPTCLGYWEYYDSWSMGDSFDRLKMPEAMDSIQFSSGHIRPYKITTASGPWLKQELQNRQFEIEEYKWLYETMLKAVETFGTLGDPTMVLVFREVIGASFDDSEAGEQNK